MRQEVFAVAYQEARSELLDITCKFEELLQRKERLEAVVAALGPMLGVSAAVMPAPAEMARESVAEPAPSFGQVAAQEQDDESSITDPFQRRLRNALKFNGPRRDGLLKAM